MAGLYLLRAGGFVAGGLATSYLYYVTIVQRVRDDHAANMTRIGAMEGRLFKASAECDEAVQKAFGLLTPVSLEVPAADAQQQQ